TPALRSQGNGGGASYTYTDGEAMLIPQTDYFYRLSEEDNAGNREVLAIRSATLRAGEAGANLPREFELKQNYPNPFNPGTVIEYELPVKSDVAIKVFDMLGREVQSIVNEQKAAGRYEVKFNAARLSSGIYFYRLIAKSEQGITLRTKKMTLVK
ncbi:MAG: T9SS type A sorting domain-containing protein, partial [Rhizobacter sp.]|nr:T9SS type A sorting domain-containing protein [Chlorobiales bacterium]